MQEKTPLLKLGLPKGRMQVAIVNLMAEAGIQFGLSDRGYRPKITWEGVETKILKPQSVVKMLAQGSRDIGFAGADWVRELNVDLVEVLDTKLNQVKVVAAAPGNLLQDGILPNVRLTIATEYEQLTRAWVEQKKLDAQIVRSYGATEVFPPEDADLIVDNTATGQTLVDNGLVIFDELMRSSTRMYVSRAAFEDPQKKQRIDTLCMLLNAVLEGRQRVLLELNVSEINLPQVIETLPAMKQPTVAPLYGGTGYAVKAAVMRDRLTQIVPLLKDRGGRDIIVTNLTQIVP